MSEATHAFGVDIGGTTVKMGLFTAEGELVDSWEIPTVTEGGGIQVLPDIAGSVRQAMAAMELEADSVVGIGVGVPGPVRDESVVLSAVNLGWGELDVAAELVRLTGIENVKVGNDANVATLGEQWKGGGQGYDDVIMLTLGTGVGGGIVHNGRIIGGSHGAAGEIGHITTDTAETAPCGCGKTGHLEQYASATGIAAQARRLLAGTDIPSVLRDAQFLSAKEVLDAAKAGDALGLDVLDWAATMLGRALATLAIVTDPQAFIIGGGVSKAGPILVDAIDKHFRHFAFHAHENTPVLLASLGNAAGIHGAAKMVL